MCPGESIYGGLRAPRGGIIGNSDVRRAEGAAAATAPCESPPVHVERLMAPASATRRRSLLLGILFALTPSPSPAQLQSITVAGRVFGPDGSPFRSAEVVLLDTLSQDIARVTSDDEGRFRLRGVAPGTYYLQAEALPLRSGLHQLTFRDGLPIQVDLKLSPQLAERVHVASDASGPGGVSGVTLSGEAVRRRLTPVRGNALRGAIAEAPGWTSEDNGLMHYRGSDDGILFVLDGVPVYERLDPQFGLGFDPLTLRSVRVLSGHVPAEFGLRAGGVIEVRSEGGAVESWSGVLETGMGSERSQAVAGLAQGPVGRDASLTLNLGGERSRRFLDPPALDNLHNQGSTAGGEAELVWAPGGTVVSFRAGHARSFFDVPQAEAQEEAGQDQRQRLEQSFATLNWQRLWPRATVSQVALFGRFTRGKLLGSAADVPLFAEAARDQQRLGVLAAVAHEKGRHRFKAGVEASWIRLDEAFRFFVSDPRTPQASDLSEGVLDHDRDNPFDFADRVRRPIVSFHAQDSWRPMDGLTIDLGLRFDRSRLLLTESQWSPRLGVSYRAGRTVLRASLNRFFQPPQTEYLLLSSSTAAHRLSPFAGELGGGRDIPSERQTAVEAGCEFRLAGALRADLAVWQRRIRNQGDPNVFLGTTIVFPNSVERGRAKGFDLRLDAERWHGVSGFITYTMSKVDQFGPINGGLFLDDEIIEIGPGTKFTPDHDQRHALSAEVSYEGDRRRLWLSVSGRYRTGTPLEVSEEELVELAERPGADLVDFARGRVKAYALFDVRAGRRLVRRQRLELSAQAAVLNVAGARYAFNFGNPFSGTHFGARRSVRMDVRLELR